MGGNRKFTQRLQSVFDNGNYDPANEPDIAYPYLFSYIKGEEWRTQLLTRQWLEKVFHNAPNGIPGNDDTGTMSAWAVFAMMGFYPDNPADASYTLTAPVFDRITLHLDPAIHGTDRIRSIRLGGRPFKAFRISHADLLRGGHLDFELQ